MSSKLKTDLTEDSPIKLDANYQFTKDDRRYIDDQALAAQEHIVESLISGQHCTWYELSPSSAAVSIGQCVCSASQAQINGIPIVTLATTAALANAGGAVAGIVLAAANPGSRVLVALSGNLPPSITNLPQSTGFAKVNTATGFIIYASGLTSSDHAVGTVDAIGNLTVSLFLTAVSGGAGTLLPTGTTVGEPLVWNGTAWDNYHDVNHLTVGSTDTPLFSQADVITASATGTAFTIQAQNATGTTSTGGSLNLYAGTGTTAPGAVNFGQGSATYASIETLHGRGTFGGHGTDYKSLAGPVPGSETTLAGLWCLPNATAVAFSNVAVMSDGNVTTVNAPGAAVTFMAANSTYMAQFNNSIATNQFFLQTFKLVAGAGGADTVIFNNVSTTPSMTLNGTGQTEIIFSNTVSTTYIHQASKSTGVTGAGFVIEAQPMTGPGSTGGTLWLRAGSGASASGTINFGVVNLIKAQIETAHGRATFGGDGTDFKTIAGPVPGLETTVSALWCLANAGVPSTTNWAVASDGTQTYINSQNQALSVMSQNSSTMARFWNANSTPDIEFYLGLFQLVAGGPGGADTIAFFNTGSSPSMRFGATVTNPFVFHNAAISDVATTDLTIQSQAPFASAVTNKNSGNLILNVPAPVSGGSPGSVFVKGSGSYVAGFNTTDIEFYTTVMQGVVGGPGGAATWAFVNLVASPALVFGAGTTTPIIYQGDTSVGSGTSLTIRAQNSTAAAQNGGNVDIKAGSGLNVYGLVSLWSNPYIFRVSGQGGAPWQYMAGSGASTVANVLSDGSFIAGVNSEVKLQVSPAALLFASTVTSPTVYQADIATAAATGQLLTVHAQNATGTGATRGGDLTLASGTGATNGTVRVYAGNGATLGLALDTSIGVTTLYGTQAQVVGTAAASINAGSGTAFMLGGTIQFMDSAANWAIQITPAHAGTTTVAFASTVTSAIISQNDNATAAATGTMLKVQAQNATGTGATTGGKLALYSGTGATAGLVSIGAGLDIFTFATSGGINGVLATPFGSFTLNSGDVVVINSGANRNITLQSGGTSSNIILGTSNGRTVTLGAGFVFDVNNTAPGLAQADLPGNGATANNLSILAQNATGSTSHGGNLILSSGIGSSSRGAVIFQAGGTEQARIYSNSIFQFTEIQSPTIFQNDQTSDTATYNFVIKSQAPFVSSTGTNRNPGSIVLDVPNPNGAGAEGSIQLQKGNTTYLSFTSVAQSWASTATSPTINQTDIATAAATGQAFKIQAQNSTGTGATTGGQLTLTSGTGATVGNMSLQLGGTESIGISNGTVLLGTTAATLAWATGTVAPTFKQNDVTTTAATAANLTIQAQNSTGSGATTGGTVVVKAGTGSTQGAISLQSDNVKFIDHGASNFGGLPGLVISMGTTPTFQFAAAVVGVAFNVLQAGSGAGTNFTITAQQAGSGTNPGGNLQLSGGANAAAGGVYGSVLVQSPLNEGELTLQPSAGANSLSNAQSNNNVFIFGPTQASAYTITLARRIADTSRIFVRNNCAGTATISYLTGGTVTVATGTSALICSDGSNLQKIIIGT